MQPFGFPTFPANNQGYSFGHYGQPTTGMGMPAPAPINPLSFGSMSPSPAPVAAPAPVSPAITRAESTSNGVGPDSVDTGSFFRDADGNLDFGNIGVLLKGIGAIGNVWGGIQANKIAKDTLAFQKDAYATNLANSISSYNMALEDRAYARAAQKGTGRDAADRYISKYRLEG